MSYKDIPVMKDLLVTQKKIRSILEDWLVFCRNSLGIMEPEMYILPDLPNKHKISRLNENHSDFDKIVLHRHKSKSAENLITPSETVLFETNIKKLTNSLLKKSRVFAEQKRSKSAVIGSLEIFFFFYIFSFLIHLVKIRDYFFIRLLYIYLLRLLMTNYFQTKIV